jgi:tetratricopeptide (TPR) repeat protein
MWLETRLKIVKKAAEVVIFEADDIWGVPYIIASLDTEEIPLIWLQFTPDHLRDPVAQGNVLADAVKKALGSPLFGYGLPFHFGLSVLSRHLELLGPFTLAVSGGEYGLEVIGELLGGDFSGCRRVVAFSKIPSDFALPTSCSPFGPQDLKMTLDEAVWMADSTLPQEEIRRVWQESGGAYENVKRQYRAGLELPSHYEPTPRGGTSLPSQTFEIPPAVLFHALTKRKQWVEAFEIAVEHRIEGVKDLIEPIGIAYFERGLFQRFWELLCHLPTSLRQNEAVLFWMYSAAIAVNQHRTLTAEVRAYLDHQDAPELRALYASATPNESSISLARQAVAVKETPVTLRLYGFLLSVFEGSEDATKVLLKALNLSEMNGLDHEVVTIGNLLSSHLCRIGRFRAAAHWAEWTLEQFYQRGSKEELRRLETIGNLAFSRLLIGRLAGLEDIVQDFVLTPSLYGIPSMEGIISTMGDYMLVTGKQSEALRFYQINFKHLPLQQAPYAALDLIRGMVYLKQYDAALEIAERMLSLLPATVEPLKAYGYLAYGIAKTYRQPTEAKPYFLRALELSKKIHNAVTLTQANLHLARLYLLEDRFEEARRSLVDGEPGIGELGETGWRLLGGPNDDFRDVRMLWNGTSVPMQLVFLGDQQVRIDFESQEFRLRLCELLAILALHPEGLDGEELALHLYGDGANLSTVKATISKLRGQVTIDSRPYRLAVPFEADFIEAERHLGRGNVREALELYRGPLLPKSQAPLIVEYRERLEENLRQAALYSGDAKVLIQLAQRLEDDLVLWEATKKTLSLHDPLYPLVSARITQLRKAWNVL